MKHIIRKIFSSVLVFGLALGCGGCSSSAPEPLPIPLPDHTVSTPVSPHLLTLPNLIAAPQYPDCAQCPRPEDYPDYNEYQIALNDWRINQNLQKPSIPEDVRILAPFLETTVKQLLSGGGNQVCSPMNIYFALAILAEAAEGNSRQQILDTLGYSDIHSLRTQAKQLWEAIYCSDGQTVSLLANSLWLDEAFSFNQEGISTLSQQYYASVFNGDLGSADLDRQLVQWLNSQTGDLLSEYSEEIKLSPDTVFALASTAYFCAGWSDSFEKTNTQPKVFHSKDRDLTVDFMHQTLEDHMVFWNEDFSAISMSLADNYRMWLILPDEDKSPEYLLQQGDYYDLIALPNWWDELRYANVNLSMPKFDISSDQDLIENLQAMGIQDVFDPESANFSGITDRSVFASASRHAARVAVDEDGVMATAYTQSHFELYSSFDGLLEVDFTLDRPFLFVITGQDDLPMFAGVVENP